MKATRFLALFLILLVFSFLASALAEETPACFFRFDLDDANAWKGPLSNVRFLTKDAWSLAPISPEKCQQYGISPDYVPSTQGLDTLNISGSAAFSENQFRQLAADLRMAAGNKEIWVIDCRLESHELVNGIAVSWYGDQNWANKGLTLEEAEAEEALRFDALPGSAITVYTAEDNVPANPQEISVEKTMTERELVESEGFRYLRLAANDHSWPEEEAIDSFLSFVEELNETVGLDNVWLHFHCHAGKSRTGTFMAIYDMIRNPSVSFDDIMLRHAMTGSSYLPYVNEQSDIKDVYALRALRIRQLYDYLHGERRTPWSNWVMKEDEAERTARLTARCATVEEEQELMRGRTLLHAQINEKTLDFLLQRKGGTVEEYIEFSARQVLAFTQEEEQRVQNTMAWLNQLLESHGLKLPNPGPVSFVKTTCKEQVEAAGYTSEGTIFLRSDLYSSKETPEDQFRLVVLHELSHCLSRLFPEYRQALYSLIHFTVLDHDIEIPEEIFNQIIANPDVEHHNSCATFTINGEKKDCYIVCLTTSVFEKEGDSFLWGMYPGIVPLDGNTIYKKDDVEDFWEVFGRNTTYVTDPEEAMANNFAYALLSLDKGYGDASNPEILEGIIEYLKK